MKQWTPEEVRAFRDALGLTRERMAWRLGVSIATVVRWELGTNEPSPVMKRLLNDVERQNSAGTI